MFGLLRWRVQDAPPAPPHPRGLSDQLSYSSALCFDGDGGILWSIKTWPMPMRGLKFNLATASCFGKPLLALSDLEYSEALLK